MGLGSLDITNAFAVVAICWIGRRCILIERAAGTIEVLGFRQAMQEDVDEGRVFNLRGETELGLEIAHLAPAVALPIGVLPLPVASVVLGHHLGLAVSGGGRHRPFDHRFVDHRNGDREIGVLVVFVRDVAATVLLHDFDVARNADELGPSSRIGGAEGTSGLVRISVEAGCVDVVTEGVVADDAVDSELEAGEAGVEVGIGIPVTVVALGLEVECASDTGIRDHDVEELHPGLLGDIQTEGIVFVLQLNEGIIKHVEREISDLVQVGWSDFNLNGAEVITSCVVSGVLRDEPRLIVEETAVGSVVCGEADPLVSGLTNVVRTEKLFVDILGDAGIALFKLEDFLGGEEAIEKALDANPVGMHFLAQEFKGVRLCAGTLDDLAIGGTRIRAAIGVVDFVERGARVIEATPETEGFLLGGVVKRPRLLLEAGEVSGVRDEFLHIEVVEILTALAEKAVQLFTGIEDNL